MPDSRTLHGKLNLHMTGSAFRPQPYTDMLFPKIEKTLLLSFLEVDLYLKIVVLI